MSTDGVFTNLQTSDKGSIMESQQDGITIKLVKKDSGYQILVLKDAPRLIFEYGKIPTIDEADKLFAQLTKDAYFKTGPFAE